MPGAAELSYVLPLRWSHSEGLEELASYLESVAAQVAEVVVVDGSEPAFFARHGERLGGFCRHIRPDPGYRFAMGKVDGVTTGVLAARAEGVVVADDDVRYDSASLQRIAALLEGAHLVRPQNHFDPLPWHARLDSARSLLNRVCTGDLEFRRGDFPGTLALRRSSFVAVGGYDGNVMFENLELMRTISAAGGVVVSPLDLCVRRLPPSTGHFLSQRVRQAYDDFAVPLRMTAFLAVLPAVAATAAARRFRGLALAAAAIAGLAEAGRRSAGGSAHFSAGSSLLAPLWVLERGVSAWLALARRLAGGVLYSGRRIERSASSPRELRARLAGIRLGDVAWKGDGLVGAVAEGRDPRAPAAAEGDRAAA